VPSPDDEIRAFWPLFRATASDLAASESADSAAYDLLLAGLQKVDAGLSLEFSAPDQGACELIVTADGDPDLFPIARAVVAAAPEVEGWTIRALKPRLGLPETARWGDLTVNIDTMVFEPLENDESQLGLRIFVPGLDPEDADAAHNAVLRALDHALGEERFAVSVHHTEVVPLPVDASADDYIPISDLENFIEWRERRRGGDN
jgi:hypothetical protein